MLFRLPELVFRLPGAFVFRFVPPLLLLPERFVLLALVFRLAFAFRLFALRLLELLLLFELFAFLFLFRFLLVFWLFALAEVLVFVFAGVLVFAFASGVSVVTGTDDSPSFAVDRLITTATVCPDLMISPAWGD